MSSGEARDVLLSALLAARLPRPFYARSAVTVAPALLGTLLVSYITLPDSAPVLAAGLVVETEAYDCPNDPACWAYRKRTPRNGVIWGAAGYAYIYAAYRVHAMFNVVVESEDYPATVLVRAVAPVYGLEAMQSRRTSPDVALTNGPGKVSAALGIDSRFNGIDLVAPDSPIFFAAITPEVCEALYALPASQTEERGGGLTRLRDPSFCPPPIVQAARIGLSQGRDLPWRYYYYADPYVSVRDRAAEARFSQTM